jgi:hypothetical protein
VKLRSSHWERGPSCRLLEERDIKVVIVAEAMFIGARYDAKGDGTVGRPPPLLWAKVIDKYCVSTLRPAWWRSWGPAS